MYKYIFFVLIIVLSGNSHATSKADNYSSTFSCVFGSIERFNQYYPARGLDVMGQYDLGAIKGAGGIIAFDIDNVLLSSSGQPMFTDSIQSIKKLVRHMTTADGEPPMVVCLTARTYIVNHETSEALKAIGIYSKYVELPEGVKEEDVIRLGGPENRFVFHNDYEDPETLDMNLPNERGFANGIIYCFASCMKDGVYVHDINKGKTLQEFCDFCEGESMGLSGDTLVFFDDQLDNIASVCHKEIKSVGEKLLFHVQESLLSKPKK